MKMSQFVLPLERTLSPTRSWLGSSPYRKACLKLMAALADLTFHTTWDAHNITQMGYRWITFVLHVAISVYARWLFLAHLC